MLNNGMCGKCFARLYYEDCEDFDQEYCATYLQKFENIEKDIRDLFEKEVKI